MNSTDQILRDAVHEYAEHVRDVPGLADAARRQGRRIRLRRRMAAAAASVVVVLAVVSLAIPLHDREPAPTVKPGPTPTASPVVVITSTVTEARAATLAGGWTVQSAGDWSVGNWVLDGPRFRQFPVTDAQLTLPAPNGQLVAVLPNGSGSDTVIIDRPDGTRVRTIHPPVADNLTWSPQSDRLLGSLATSKDSSDNPGFEVIDVVTGRTVTHTPPTVSHCSECGYVWTRDGTGVTLAIVGTDSSDANITVSEVDVFDAATGAARPTVAIDGFPRSPFAWSPDGIHAIGRTGDGPVAYALFDLQAHTSVAFPCDGRFVDDQTIVCATNNSEVDTYQVDGTLIARAIFGGQLTQPGRLAQSVTLGPGR